MRKEERGNGERALAPLAARIYSLCHEQVPALALVQPRAAQRVKRQVEGSHQYRRQLVRQLGQLVRCRGVRAVGEGMDDVQVRQVGVHDCAVWR